MSRIIVSLQVLDRCFVFFTYRDQLVAQQKKKVDLRSTSRNNFFQLVTNVLLRDKLITLGERKRET